MCLAFCLFIVDRACINLIGDNIFEIAVDWLDPPNAQCFNVVELILAFWTDEQDLRRVLRFNARIPLLDTIDNRWMKIETEYLVAVHCTKIITNEILVLLAYQ